MIYLLGEGLLRAFSLAVWCHRHVVWENQGVPTLHISAPRGLPTPTRALCKFWPMWVSSSCSVQGRQRCPSQTIPCSLAPSSRQAAGLILRRHPSSRLFRSHTFPALWFQSFSRSVLSVRFLLRHLSQHYSLFTALSTPSGTISSIN